MLIQIDDDVPAVLLARALAGCGLQLRTDGSNPPRLKLGEGLRAEIAEYGDTVHQVRAQIAAGILVDARQIAANITATRKL